MKPEQFKSLQLELGKLYKAQSYQRYCFNEMNETRELRKAVGTVTGKHAMWLKAHEQFWKRAYWRASNDYELIKRNLGL